MQRLLVLACATHPARAQSVAEVLMDRSKWDRAERNRVLAALNANSWRRQGTAPHRGISRNFVW